MEIVKEYKGVNIYHDTVKNEYYCDAKYNSSKYEDKTHTGSKVQHIERAINDCEGYPVEDIVQYYVIDVINPSITLLQVVKRLGKHLYFNDDTSTKQKDRYRLYPKSIDEEPEFKTLLSLIDKSKEVVTNMYDLGKIYRVLTSDIKQELSKYKRVSITVDNKLIQE